jgi:hypothetical protein
MTKGEMVMKKSALTKMRKLVFGSVLVLVFFLGGTFDLNSKASVGNRTVELLADSGGTAGQLTKTAFKKAGTAGQQMWQYQNKRSRPTLGVVC